MSNIYLANCGILKFHGFWILKCCTRKATSFNSFIYFCLKYIYLKSLFNEVVSFFRLKLMQIWAFRSWKCSLLFGTFKLLHNLTGPWWVITSWCRKYQRFLLLLQLEHLHFYLHIVKSYLKTCKNLVWNIHFWVFLFPQFE